MELKIITADARQLMARLRHQAMAVQVTLSGSLPTSPAKNPDVGNFGRDGVRSRHAENVAKSPD
jgi:hypothetical protein